MSSQFITRPALRTVATSHAAGTYRLRLTIVFHPDLDRIGTYVDVHCWAVDKPLTSILSLILAVTLTLTLSQRLTQRLSQRMSTCIRTY